MPEKAFTSFSGHVTIKYWQKELHFYWAVDAWFMNCSCCWLNVPRRVCVTLLLRCQLSWVTTDRGASGPCGMCCVSSATLVREGVMENEYSPWKGTYSCKRWNPYDSFTLQCDVCIHWCVGVAASQSGSSLVLLSLASVVDQLWVTCAFVLSAYTCVQKGTGNSHCVMVTD